MNQEGSQGNNSSAAAVNAITLPEFEPSSPNSWFSKAELLFKLERITSDSNKVKTVIRALPSSIIDAIIPFINDPLACGYETLKKLILDRFTPSVSQKIDILSQTNDLSHLHPVDLLRRLRDTFGPAVNEDYLRESFPRRLPKNIQEMLEILDLEAPLDQLAKSAARAMDRRNQYLNTCQVSNSSNQENLLRDIQNQLKILSMEVSQLSRRITKLERTRSKSRGRTPPLKPPSSDLYDGLC